MQWHARPSNPLTWRILDLATRMGGEWATPSTLPASSPSTKTASTLVQISCLAVPGALIEIEAVAVIE